MEANPFRHRATGATPTSLLRSRHDLLHAMPYGNGQYDDTEDQHAEELPFSCAEFSEDLF